MKSKTIYQFWTWKIFAHFKTIKDEPSKFFLWFLTSIILSLSSFWIPIIIGFLIKEDFYCLLMMNNPFIVFSIVFLSNTILYSINHIGGGSNKFAVNIRGITLVTLIMYLILLSTIIPLKLLKDISLEHDVQFILLTITIMLGIYAYGFRESTWEKSVDEANKEQNETVAEMAMKANNTNKEEGFKL
jgi:hypothetical protein